MSDRRTIDGFEFSRAAGRLEGRRAIAEFGRLRDLLAQTAGSVEYVILGVHDEHGRPALKVAVSGLLQLRCQRCLNSLAFAVSVDSLLVLAATQEEIDAATDAQDRLLAAQDLDIWNLIEDELLLAVPYAPRHDRCNVPGEARNRPHVTLGASPFADLRGLLGGRERTGRARRR